MSLDNDMNSTKEHRFVEGDQNDKVDYKKAFELLLCAMVMKTLAPSTEQLYGSPDICINCMKRGLNLAYGDDGDKKPVCDRCPYNITAYKGCEAE